MSGVYRFYFVTALVVMFAGAAVAALSEGDGGPVPTVSEARPFKIAGAAMLALGTVLATGTAVVVYMRDRKHR
jgi:hypothetical protein